MLNQTLADLAVFYLMPLLVAFLAIWWLAERWVRWPMEKRAWLHERIEADRQHAHFLAAQKMQMTKQLARLHHENMELERKWQTLRSEQQQFKEFAQMEMAANEPQIISLDAHRRQDDGGAA